MRIIEPAQLPKRQIRPKRRLRFMALFLLLVLVIGGYVTAAYAKPLPSITIQTDELKIATTALPAIQWPGYGQAAVGASGYGVLATQGVQTKVPIASVAKVVTALAVLTQKPLAKGEQGPTITITEADAESYHDYIAQDGSVVPVNVGEQISEYQALQALLLPSANNMAFTLTRWAFGSVDAYLTYANQLVQSLDMKQTHLADASGFSPESASTATDLVKLGEAAMKNPVLAQIVGQASAVIPVAGEIRNVNFMLGRGGIDGIKTGNTNEAGGCFLFTTERTYPGNKKIRLIGAILAAPDLGTALRDSSVILNSAASGFENVTILDARQPVGRFTTAWGSSAQVITQAEISALIWKGTPLVAKAHLNNAKAPQKSGAEAGMVIVNGAKVPISGKLVLKNSLTAPSFNWRVRHVWD